MFSVFCLLLGLLKAFWFLILPGFSWSLKCVDLLALDLCFLTLDLCFLTFDLCFCPAPQRLKSAFFLLCLLRPCQPFSSGTLGSSDDKDTEDERYLFAPTPPHPRVWRCHGERPTLCNGHSGVRRHFTGSSGKTLTRVRSPWVLSSLVFVYTCKITKDPVGEDGFWAKAEKVDAKSSAQN